MTNMLRHVAAFEWRYQRTSPVFWVGFALFFLLTFGATTVEQIQIGGRGNVHVNAPFAIVQTLAVMSLFALFIVVAMVSNVVVRDDETGFAPLLRATRVGKGSYLGGRFLGAVLAALAVLASIPLAIALGSAMPWLDAERVGPFVPGHYLWALLAFGLPTLLILSAAFFALATATRSMMWTYVGAVAVLVLYVVMRGLLSDPRHDTLAALADPFGLAALEVGTKYWTVAERNTQLPTLTGVLLLNRLLWSGAALALFALAYRLFRFEQRAGKVAPAAPAAAAAAAGAAGDAGEGPRPGVRAGPLPAVRADRATRWAQLLRLARFDVAFVMKSPAFGVLLALGLFNASGALWTAGELYGSPSHPVTRLMVGALMGAYGIIPLIISIFYAGELVWRDRDRRMHEMVDATAAPDWAHLVPKVLAITLVLVATTLVGVLAGVAVQALRGHFRFELGHYLLWFVLPMSVGALQLAVLAVVVQVLVPQKFLGWGVALLQVVAQVALGTSGYSHVLYDFGNGPPVPLSDMNGAGRFWVGQLWGGLYWSAFCLVLAVVAHLLWRRGAVQGLRTRLPQARRRLKGGALVPLAAGLLVWAGAGAWVFHNTNVLNTWRTTPQQEALQADMERALLPYEAVPLPTITAVTLDVQLHPREARAVTRGSYAVENRTGAPLEALHVAWFDERLRLDEMEVPGGTVEKEYPEFHYRIYRLSPAMQPGEQRTLRFATTIEERGFSNGAPFTRVVENGTFLEAQELAPTLGMNRGVLLRERSTRRKHGLPPDLRPLKLEDPAGRAHSPLRRDSEWVMADLTVTTDADQVPVAPGAVVSDTTEGGRRTVRFRTDAPINHFFSVQSARYQVARDRWEGVELAVYHHPDHAWNVPRMMEAMKVSLGMFSERFSPYQFKQLRILEFPAYGSYAQAFANTIPFSENIGFLHRHTDPEKIDMVTYVTAHEVAHQWWAHQLVPGDQQGATLLIESFAQYSALLVMEKMYGREQVRRFLKYELDRYLRSRGSEAVEELPLARVENQQYIHYQKGTLAMYWLKEAVGEEKVNRALSRLVRQHAFKPAPHPNALDFLALLREEAGPEHGELIADLFERITLLDAKVLSASASKREDGRYAVTLEVEARKYAADGQGQEAEVPLDEPYEVGVFTAEPGRAGFTPQSVLAFERQRLKSGRQQLTLVVAEAPAFAGVDPYNKRVDRNSEDNLKAVDLR
jgi:aminopeptidase N